MQKIDSSICVVVPVFNAKDSIEELVRRLIKVLIGFSRFSIVLVDDGSTDGSFDIIKKLCADNDCISGARLKKNFGQQSAVFCGLEFSDCDYTVIIDDDLENNPEDIVPLYGEILKGYDAVYALNSAQGKKGAVRRLGSRLRDRLFDRATSKPKDIKVCSFRILNSNTVEKILRADTKFVYISLEMLKHTNNIGNIFVHYNAHPSSKYVKTGLFWLLTHMYIYYTKPLKFLRRKGACFETGEICGGNR